MLTFSRLNEAFFYNPVCSSANADICRMRLKWRSKVTSHTSPIWFLTSVGSMCCVFMKQKTPVMAPLGSDWQSCCHFWDNWCSSCYQLYIGWHVYRGVDSFTDSSRCLRYPTSKQQQQQQQPRSARKQLWWSITYRHSVQRYSWTFLPGKRWKI